MATLFNVPFFVAFIFLVSSTANAATSPSNLLFANTTSLSSGTITAAPSQITSSLSKNTSCSSCVIALDIQGLQQVVWLTETWSATLDTEYVTVTSFNGSNATAITSTRSVLGNAASLNASANPYASFLYSVYEINNGYINTDATFVRGTDGNVGTTSFPYGQAYAEVTAVNYRHIGPNIGCPVNMGPAPVGGSDCQCRMNTWFPPFLPEENFISTTTYGLDRTYYQPISSSQMNEHLMVGQDIVNALAPWDGERFSAWLAEDEGFKSVLPNWEDCAYWNTAGGPPGVKIPVAALTTTISTTVQSTGNIWSPTAKPADQPATPTEKPTVPPTTSPTSSGSEGGSAGSENGGSDGSQSGGSGDSGSVGSQDSNGSGTSGDTGSSGSGGDTSSQGNNGSGNSDTGSSGSNGDTSSQGNNGSGNPDTGSSGSSGDTGSQGGGESGNSDTTGFTGPEDGDEPTSDSGSGTATQGGESSAGGYSGGNEPGTPGNEETESSGSSGSSGLGISGSNNRNPTTPFVVSVDGHTVSGTVLGSTAVAVAETTIAAGSSPISAGGVLISVHPGASSIAINGDSQPLPTARPAYPGSAPIATIGGQIITASPGASEVYYAGTTLSRDGPHATISNKDVYVGSSGLVIDSSSTIALPTALTQESSSADEPSAVTFTAAGHTFTLSPSGIAFAGTVLPSGGATVISGNTISYGTNGLQVGTSIIPVPTPRPSAADSGANSIQTFTLGGQVFTANPIAVGIAGTTLTLGGSALTVSGTAISLGSSGIVIASSTYAIPSGALPSSTTVIGGETFTINPTAIEVGGTTLGDGGSAVTINGTAISLGGSAGLVVGGSTVSFRNNPSTTTTAGTTGEGLGAIILAGFGPSSTSASTNVIAPTASGTSTLAAFQGKAATLGRSWEQVLGLGALLLAGWMICFQTR